MPHRALRARLLNAAGERLDWAKLQRLRKPNPAEVDRSRRKAGMLAQNGLASLCLCLLYSVVSGGSSAQAVPKLSSHYNKTKRLRVKVSGSRISRYRWVFEDMCVYERAPGTYIGSLQAPFQYIYV